MVVNGFSLLELRKLYLDELYHYYEQLFYSLEKMGKIEKGSYAKIVESRDQNNASEVVNSLRKQMFKSIAAKNKK